MRPGRLVASALVGGLACNAVVGFDELERADDVVVPDGSASDRPEDAGRDRNAPPDEPAAGDGSTLPVKRCNPDARFGTPEIVTELIPPSGTQSGLAISANELEAFYAVFDDTSTVKLRHARRPSREEPWTAVNDPISTNVGSPNSIVKDGLTLYTTLGPTKSFVLTRGSTEEAFTTAQSFDTSAVSIADFGFSVTTERDRAYFSIPGAISAERIIAVAPLAARRFGPCHRRPHHQGRRASPRWRRRRHSAGEPSGDGALLLIESRDWRPLALVSRVDGRSFRPSDAGVRAR